MLKLPKILAEKHYFFFAFCVYLASKLLKFKVYELEKENWFP